MKIKIYGKEVDEREDFKFFGEEQPVPVRTFEFSRARGIFETQPVELDLDPGPIELQFEDGTVWFTQSDEMPDLFSSGERSVGGDFEVPGFIEIPTGEGEAMSRSFLSRINVFNPQGVAEEAAVKAADKFESQILEEGLKYLEVDFKLSVFSGSENETKLDVSKPVLLFIHGTSSDTEGSFGELKESEAWTGLRKHYGNNILAFEHKTWTKSPLQNALDLLEELPFNAIVHLVSHSRGGIIGDILCRCSDESSFFTEAEINDLIEKDRKADAEVLKRLNSIAAEKSLAVERFVRVACPAAGTTLLSKRLDHFLNFLLNVVGFGIGGKLNPFFIAIKNLLTTLVLQKNRPDLLPGLEAMIPGSPIQSLLNNSEIKISNNLHIISGNAGSGAIKKMLTYLLTRLYYRTDNDFVVDTDSMYEGAVRENKIYHKHVSGGEVDHFSYFKNEDTQKAVFNALTAVEGQETPGFEEVREEESTRGLLLSNSPEFYQNTLPEPEPAFPVKVSVKNGHLMYAKYPVIIGHFNGDGIVSAENVMDFLLEQRLSEKEELGSYPGQIGTNLILLPDEKHDMGAVIVGLGEPESLTPHLLSRTIESACLDYVLAIRDFPFQTETEQVGVSTLLVGSSYGNLSLTNSINAILKGVLSANKKIHNYKSRLPLISEVEFLELYQDKALNAYYNLDRTFGGAEFKKIELTRPVRYVEGYRTFMPFDDEKEWWKRITALVKTENVLEPVTGEIKEEKYYYFSASVGRAGVPERNLFTNQSIIEALLKKNSHERKWNRDLSKTLFELLIPNDFKLPFINQQNFLLILDKATACYPWELLHYDVTSPPICTSTGMIRQLATSYDRKWTKPIYDNNALIIGDPLLSSGSLQQLPGAVEEALVVDSLLKNKHFSTTTLIQKSFDEIIVKLYDEYKVIHIASHGGSPGPGKEPGILLSDNIALTAAEINQISATPELVFVNSCYLGKIDPSKEDFSREKYRLAANIGTQLIENGVKAVVIAGWAVHDGAAKRFAKVFYSEMLEGETFADAVKAARKACYEEFPHSTTWGAYQCYGDQFYKLEKKRRRKKADSPYILDKEVLIDLEILINDAKSARKRNALLKERLETIIRNKDASGIRSAAVIEMEAMAYAEIGGYKTAIDKYQSLHTENKANFSVKSLEQWCNLRSQYLVILKKEKTRTVSHTEMNGIIKQLNQLLDLGKTSERYSLLGSAYKRKSILAERRSDKEKAVEAMADNYKAAFLLNNDDQSDIRIYPLVNWIIAEKLLDKKERLARMGKIGNLPVKKFLNEKLLELQKGGKEKKDFWDLIEEVNINQCKLLFSRKAKEQREIVEDIINSYHKAWKMGGSKRDRTSEKAQMEFIRDCLENFDGKNSGLIEAIDGLMEFFEKDTFQ